MVNEKSEEIGIIYGWYCAITDKWYIGQTVEPKMRFYRHIKSLVHKDNNYFHRALRKYGLENFVYCILEENVLRENLNMKEQEWIEYYDSFYNGYNMTTGGGQTIFSEESRRKLSNSLKGRDVWNKGKTGIYSEETIQKMSIAKNKSVIQYDLNDNYIDVFNSISDAGHKLNINLTSISQVCQGKRRQAGGFIWKYA